MKRIKVNKKELRRLIDAFSEEATKFHDLRFSTFMVTQDSTTNSREFDRPNHLVMLWQYYGSVREEAQLKQLTSNLMTSNIGLVGVRGAQISQYALLEGEPLQLFLRMARRAGSLFNQKTADKIKIRIANEITDDEILRNPSVLPMSVSNSNSLAIWLNYILYHLSLVNPDATQRRQIEPDPFALSLLALERLDEEDEIGKIDRSTSSIDTLRFKIALSFPGVHRPYVAQVVEKLRPSLGMDSIFYDHDYQSQLARPNLDLLLQDIYSNRSELIVVFISSDYQERPWCGLEWRSIRSLLTEKSDNKIMFIRFDDNNVDGLFSIDGYLDARRKTPVEIARAILERLSGISIK